MKMVSPSQLDMSNPGTWPFVYKLLLWIIMIVLLVFLYFNFIRKPILETQDANSAKIEELTKSYTRLYQYTLDLPQYQQRSKEVVTVLRSLLAYLPSRSEMPDLIDSVYDTATDNNIEFSAFTPEGDQVKKYYRVKPISLATETAFVSFAHFVEQISALDRILNISSMSLASAGGDSLQVNSQLQTYIYTQDIAKLMNEAGMEGEDEK